MSDYFLLILQFYIVHTDEEKKILAAIGSKVKALREKHDLSQFDLAMASDMTKNQIGRIERAEINTSILTLNKIAAVFKIDIAYFFE